MNSNEFILSKQTVLLYDSLKGSIVNPMIVIFLTYPLTSCITLKNQKIPKLKSESKRSVTRLKSSHYLNHGKISKI